MADVIAVAGAGAMGRGIAQIAAGGGYDVLLFDAKEGAAQEAQSAIAATFAKLGEKGKMTPTEAEAAAKRIHPVAPDSRELQKATIVVEAIIEHLDAKQSLFKSLEEIVAPSCVLASNTSSLSITAIAAACQRPERVAGLHFFNPVPLMKVVEVVAGLRTEDSVPPLLTQFAKRCGHTPVAAKDTPGFIVNHAGRGYGPEALRLLEENVAEAAEIDRILVDQADFRMGPFELYDLVGLDVSSAVMEQLYAAFQHEPRYRPAPMVKARVEAGLLGKKTGRGFYAYENGQIVKPPEASASKGDAFSVWCGNESLMELMGKLGARIDDAPSPASDSLILLAPLGEDVSGMCARLGLDAGRAVGVDMMFDKSKRRVAMASPAILPQYANAARNLLGADGLAVSLIKDSLGFVSQRIVANIVNIACDIAQMGIATPVDIDTAVRLGLGYPMGPLSWGDKLGPARILEILEALHRETGDMRWRPSLWLKRRARLGLSLLV